MYASYGRYVLIGRDRYIRRFSRHRRSNTVAVFCARQDLALSVIYHTIPSISTEEVVAVMNHLADHPDRCHFIRDLQLDMVDWKEQKHDWIHLGNCVITVLSNAPHLEALSFGNICGACPEILQAIRSSSLRTLVIWCWIGPNETAGDEVSPTPDLSYSFASVLSTLSHRFSNLRRLELSMYATPPSFYVEIPPTPLIFASVTHLLLACPDNDGVHELVNPLSSLSALRFPNLASFVLTIPWSDNPTQAKQLRIFLNEHRSLSRLDLDLDHSRISDWNGIFAVNMQRPLTFSAPASAVYWWLTRSYLWTCVETLAFEDKFLERYSFLELLRLLSAQKPLPHLRMIQIPTEWKTCFRRNNTIHDTAPDTMKYALNLESQGLLFADDHGVFLLSSLSPDPSSAQIEPELSQNVGEANLK
jgi:hypothetical protein